MYDNYRVIIIKKNSFDTGRIALRNFSNIRSSVEDGGNRVRSFFSPKEIYANAGIFIQRAYKFESV